MTVDLEKIEAAVREILVAIGEDPTRDGLVRTPARVARAMAEQKKRDVTQIIKIKCE